jgi:hypothetical protein
MMEFACRLLQLTLLTPLQLMMLLLLLLTPLQLLLLTLLTTLLLLLLLPQLSCGTAGSPPHQVGDHVPDVEGPAHIHTPCSSRGAPCLTRCFLVPGWRCKHRSQHIPPAAFYHYHCSSVICICKGEVRCSPLDEAWLPPNAASAHVRTAVCCCKHSTGLTAAPAAMH